MRRKFGFIVTILILLQTIVSQVLQLYVIGEAQLLSQPAPDAAVVHIFYAYITLTYLGIAALIWAEIDNLEEFHLEQFTLFIFVLTSLFRTRYRFSGEEYYLLIIALCGLSAVLALVLNRSKLPKTSLKWALAGALLGCISLIITANVEPSQFRTPLNQSIYSANIFLGLARQAVNTFSFTAPIEEIVFRGFLWGYLRRLGWKENVVSWVQGILFWALHLYKSFSTPLTFLITVPLLALDSTILVRRSKQVFPAILSHSIINVMTQVLGYFRAV